MKQQNVLVIEPMVKNAHFACLLLESLGYAAYRVHSIASLETIIKTSMPEVGILDIRVEKEFWLPYLHYLIRFESVHEIPIVLFDSGDHSYEIDIGTPDWKLPDFVDNLSSNLKITFDEVITRGA